MDPLQNLFACYRKKKREIEERLRDFQAIWHKGEEDLFAELCFCLLTPQSKAEACDDIVRTLTRNRLLFEGSLEEIAPFLKKTRFYKTKAKYLLEARRLFRGNGTFRIREKLDLRHVRTTRDRLVQQVKGLGYKEASHFLRNVGLGEDLAILDIHVLRSLKKFGILRVLPSSLTPKRYLAIEEKLRHFSRRTGIPLSHLDLLLWYVETRRIFK